VRQICYLLSEIFQPQELFYGLTVLQAVYQSDYLISMKELVDRNTNLKSIESILDQECSINENYQLILLQKNTKIINTFIQATFDLHAMNSLQSIAVPVQFRNFDISVLNNIPPFTNIQHINIVDIEYEAFANLVQLLPNVVSLRFNIKYRSKGFDKTVQILKDNSERILQSLISIKIGFNSTRITDELLSIDNGRIGRQLTSFQYHELQAMNLSEICPNLTALVTLTNVYGTMHKLKYLNLTVTIIDPNTIVQILKQCPELVYIALNTTNNLKLGYLLANRGDKLRYIRISHPVSTELVPEYQYYLKTSSSGSPTLIYETIYSTKEKPLYVLLGSHFDPLTSVTFGTCEEYIETVIREIEARLRVYHKKFNTI
jgi:hypothetical protein